MCAWQRYTTNNNNNFLAWGANAVLYITIYLWKERCWVPYKEDGVVRTEFSDDPGGPPPYIVVVKSSCRGTAFLVGCSPTWEVWVGVVTAIVTWDWSVSIGRIPGLRIGGRRGGLHDKASKEVIIVNINEYHYMLEWVGTLSYNYQGTTSKDVT